MRVGPAKQGEGSAASGLAQMFLIFSYGSNSLVQLRGRVENKGLTSRGAVLEGYTRVFCHQSTGWGESGVASLAPCEGAVTRGSLVQLTPQEKERLDQYEGGYREETVKVRVDGEEVEAIAYVAGTDEPSELVHGVTLDRSDPNAPYTLPLVERPTEQYLTAIHVHLRHHHPAVENETIAIRTCNADGTVSDVDEWTHPGVNALSLEAFVVELCNKLYYPWKMPGAITDVCGRLRAIGITCTDELLPAITEPGGGVVAFNEQLVLAKQLPFSPDEIKEMRMLLSPQPGGYEKIMPNEYRNF